MKRLATVAAACVVLAGLAPTNVAAARLKPLGYLYAGCAQLGKCAFEGSTNAQQTTINVSATKICQLGAEGLAYAGAAKIRNGRFALHKTVTVESLVTYRKAQVTVQESGTFVRGRRAKGTLKITTADEECAADSGKTQSFSLHYSRPYYGG